jgi:hypothetical protein
MLRLAPAAITRAAFMVLPVILVVINFLLFCCSSELLSRSMPICESHDHEMTMLQYASVPGFSIREGMLFSFFARALRFKKMV